MLIEAGTLSMPPPLFITAEDHKLHYLGGDSAVLLCGKVMVRPAREDELADHVLCEHCNNAANRDAEAS